MSNDYTVIIKKFKERKKIVKKSTLWLRKLRQVWYIVIIKKYITFHELKYLYKIITCRFINLRRDNILGVPPKRIYNDYLLSFIRIYYVSIQIQNHI